MAQTFPAEYGKHQLFQCHVFSRHNSEAVPQAGIQAPSTMYSRLGPSWTTDRTSDPNQGDTLGHKMTSEMASSFQTLTSSSIRTRELGHIGSGSGFCVQPIMVPEPISSEEIGSAMVSPMQGGDSSRHLAGGCQGAVVSSPLAAQRNPPATSTADLENTSWASVPGSDVPTPRRTSGPSGFTAGQEQSAGSAMLSLNAAAEPVEAVTSYAVEHASAGELTPDSLMHTPRTAMVPSTPSHLEALQQKFGTRSPQGSHRIQAHHSRIQTVSGTLASRNRFNRRLTVDIGSLAHVETHMDDGMTRWHSRSQTVDLGRYQRTSPREMTYQNWWATTSRVNDDMLRGPSRRQSRNLSVSWGDLPPPRHQQSMSILQKGLASPLRETRQSMYSPNEFTALSQLRKYCDSNQESPGNAHATEESPQPRQEGDIGEAGDLGSTLEARSTRARRAASLEDSGVLPSPYCCREQGSEMQGVGNDGIGPLQDALMGSRRSSLKEDRSLPHRRRSSSRSSSADEDAPEEYICPISREVMTDPVMVATGQTYERCSIQLWLARGHRTCPVTGLALVSVELLPNYALRHAIQSWAKRHNVLLQEPMHYFPPHTPTGPQGGPRGRSRTRSQPHGAGPGSVPLDWGQAAPNRGSTAVSAISQVLGGSEVEQEEALEVLFSVLSEARDADRSTIAEAGVMPALLAGLAGGTPLAEEWAAKCMRVLSRSTHPIVMQQVACCVPFLVEVLHQGTEEAQMAAAGVLVNLSAKTTSSKYLISASGAIPLLVGMLSRDTTLAKLEIVAAALCNISTDDENRVEIGRTPGALPRLIAVVKWCPSEEAGEYSLHALGSLAFNNLLNALLMIESGILPVLAALVHNNHIWSYEAVARTLRNLASHEEARETMRTEGAHEWLASLLQMDSTQASEAARTGLWFLDPIGSLRTSSSASLTHRSSWASSARSPAN